jgi:hypothetical protein
LFLVVFSENFHDRKMRNIALSPIAPPASSNCCASEFARDRFLSGKLAASCASSRFDRLWRRGRFVGLGPSIAQKLNKDRAVVAEARTNEIAEREISPQVVQEQSPSRIWQPLYQNDAARRGHLSSLARNVRQQKLGGKRARVSMREHTRDTRAQPMQLPFMAGGA